VEIPGSWPSGVDEQIVCAVNRRPPADAGRNAPRPRTRAPVVLSTGLHPYIEQAFTAEHVVIDVAGFSGETLHGVIQEPLDKIRTGEVRIIGVVSNNSSRAVNSYLDRHGLSCPFTALLLLQGE
jgi:hypothetical protein